MTPSPEQLDRLNDYLHEQGSPGSRVAFEAELAADPALAELYQRYNASLDELKEAFAPPPGLGSLVKQAVQRAAAEEAGAAPAPSAEPPAPTSSPAWWSQALKIAACITFCTGVFFAGQAFSPFAAPGPTAPAELVGLLRADGFKAPVSCSPEAFPEQMNKALGIPLALAAAPAGFDLLGWTYPKYFGEPVLSEDELVLMSRVDGREVVVVIDRAERARRLRASGGVQVHRRELSGLVLFELSPFDTPRVLPLLSAAPG